MAGGDLADIGALIACIEVASQHKLDRLVGKPDPYIVQIAVEAIGLPKNECLMVGDQLETDVLAGQRYGLPVALFLRDPRVREQADLSTHPPDFGLESLLELVV